MKHVFFLIALLAVAFSSCDTDTVHDVVIERDEAMYQMNRAALMRMNVGGEIAVVGHSSQDPDAVCSAISMAALMRELGMPARAFLQEKPIQAVKYILDTLGVAVPEVMTSIAPDKPLVLTDHNDYLQSLSGASRAMIVGIVDHHPVSSSFSSSLPIYCKFMNVGSTCTIVYSIFKECGIVPSRDIARVMVAGIIADTDSLSKLTCTAADSLALTQLVPVAGLNSLSDFTHGINVALDSFTGMTDEEIFLSDIKVYEIGGVKLAVASLDANESLHIDEMCERMRAVMPAVQQKLDVQMVFAKMEESFSGVDENGNPLKSYVTHIPYFGEGAKALAETAFGPTVHDNCIVLDRKVSRKTDFIPAIRSVLESE